MNATALRTANEIHLEAVPAITPRSRLRLTRRGRVVLTSLAAAPLVIVALVLGLNGGMATATGEAGKSLDVVTVSTGESLWSVASFIAPEQDPRDVIASLVQVNQLDSMDVLPGQQLLVPASYTD